MYKIIGADQKEYGPITAEQIRQWIIEGRAGAQTQVLPEGAAEWRSLGSLPEFADAFAPKSPPPGAIAGEPAFDTRVADQLKGPWIGLVVTAVLGFLFQLAALLMNVLGVSIGAMQQRQSEAWINMFSGTVGIISSILTMGIAVLILFGALRMSKLRSYGWAIAASILALAPCVSPCCLVGLPFGIWALVVLAKPEVKAAFR